MATVHPNIYFWFSHSCTKAEQGTVAGRPKAIGYICIYIYIYIQCFGCGLRELHELRELRVCGRSKILLLTAPEPLCVRSDKPRKRRDLRALRKHSRSPFESKHELPLEVRHLNCAPARVSVTSWTSGPSGASGALKNITIYCTLRSN